MIQFEGCGIDTKGEPKSRYEAFQEALKLCEEMTENQKLFLAEEGQVKVGDSIVTIRRFGSKRLPSGDVVLL